MKSKIFNLFLLLTLSMTEIVNAQISVYSTPNTNISESNYFFDASLYEGLLNQNLGRLFGFPRINLTKFRFNTSTMDKGIVYPSYFDGALVFNNATGTTIDGTPTEVGRGFYYFDNPTGATDLGVTNGKWMKLGGTNYSSNAPNGVITSNSIDGKPIYSYKGTFTQKTGETKTEFNLTVPTGITGLFKITIYNTDPNVNYYTNSVYSLTMDTNSSNTVKLVTGVPHISIVYPEGTYNYILEYLK